MTFTKEPTRVPVAIGNIVITLKDTVVHELDNVPYKAVYYDVEIFMDDGSRVTRHGDLQPHLTTEQKQALLNFVEDMRTKAETEFL